MKYMEHFEKHYRDWIKGFDNSSLVQYERNLSSFIDCELFEDFLMSDELLMLYEIIRDECVNRVSNMVAWKS